MNMLIYYQFKSIAPDSLLKRLMFDENINWYFQFVQNNQVYIPGDSLLLPKKDGSYTNFRLCTRNDFE